MNDPIVDHLKELFLNTAEDLQKVKLERDALKEFIKIQELKIKELQARLNFPNLPLD